MNVYKLDAAKEREIDSAIKDMANVLAEIAPTFRILNDLLKQHEEAISTPTIERFRQDLKNMLPEATRMAHFISTNAQLLASVSTQASRQLSSVEANIKNSLTGSESIATANTPAKSIEGTTNPGTPVTGRSNRIFQRNNQTHLV